MRAEPETARPETVIEMKHFKGNKTVVVVQAESETALPETEMKQVKGKTTVVVVLAEPETARSEMEMKQVKGKKTVVVLRNRTGYSSITETEMEMRQDAG
jgi:uncharacterized protein YyaL (SSP411 family)